MTNDNNTAKQPKVLDLSAIVKLILKKAKVYAIVVPTVTIVTMAFVLCIPRYYQCKVMLAPESVDNAGGLSSLMSQFGFGDAMQSDDAISPMLYPDLMESQQFITSLFDIQIKTKDGKLNTTYYEYIAKHQDAPFWSKAINAIINALSKPQTLQSVDKINPVRLTRNEDLIAQGIAGKMNYDYDKKTGVITIKVTDQDPLVCYTITDTLSQRLQRFITDYRTKKSRNDVENSQRFFDEAKREYDEASAAYAAFTDSNWDLVDEAFKAKATQLQNDMNLKYSTFSTISAKLQAAKAKLAEDTPVFTMVQAPYVPVKPEGPKRMIITLAMFVLSFIGTTMYIMSKEMKEAKESEAQEQTA